MKKEAWLKIAEVVFSTLLGPERALMTINVSRERVARNHCKQKSVKIRVIRNLKYLSVFHGTTSVLLLLKKRLIVLFCIVYLSFRWIYPQEMWSESPIYLFPAFSFGDKFVILHLVFQKKAEEGFFWDGYKPLDKEFLTRRIRSTAPHNGSSVCLKRRLWFATQRLFCKGRELCFNKSLHEWRGLWKPPFETNGATVERSN